MKISIDDADILITGNIKSISDFQNIKEFLDSYTQNNSNLIIKIPHSISITSAVIGYLTKLNLKDGINITIIVGDERLYRLLDELNLIRLFNVSIKK